MNVNKAISDSSAILCSFAVLFRSATLALQNAPSSSTTSAPAVTDPSSASSNLTVRRPQFRLRILLNSVQSNAKTLRLPAPPASVMHHIRVGVLLSVVEIFGPSDQVPTHAERVLAPLFPTGYATLTIIIWNGDVRELIGSRGRCLRNLRISFHGQIEFIRHTLPRSSNRVVILRGHLDECLRFAARYLGSNTSLASQFSP